MTNKKSGIGVAVIGCGQWGKNHVRTWHDLGCLRLVCDSDERQLEEIRANYPTVLAGSSLDAALKRRDVQAVVVATPAADHYETALRALEAGKDVLVEKPLAMKASEGRHLVEVAHRKNSILMAGHILEYHPAVKALRGLVRDGTLGRIQYVYAHRLNIGRIRTEENALWSFAPHDIAILLGLLGAGPEGVTCHGGNYVNEGIADVTLTTFDFPRGVKAHIFVSWLHPFKEHRFIVVGDRMMAVFDDVRDWEDKLILYPHRIEWINGRMPVANKAEARPVTLPRIEPLAEECEHFIQCVRTRRQPLTDGPSAVQVLEVLEQAQMSLESKGHKDKPELPYYIHPTAAVDRDADVGKGTKIWHFSHVMGGARIGDGCILGQNVFVGRNVRIGKGVKVQNNVSIYEGVELEDHVFCGPSAVFTNVINPRSEIERKEEFKKTLVKRGASLGANCTILCGTTIGQYALVGAGSVVTKDVPDFALAVGVPSRIVGWVCRCGRKLRFETAQANCSSCQTTYRKVGGQISVQPLREKPPGMEALQAESESGR